MKIAILIPDDYAAGGIQRSALAARDCLIDGGHEVVLLAIKLVPGGHAERSGTVDGVTAMSTARLRFWPRFLIALRRRLIDEHVDVVIGLGLAPSVVARLATLGRRKVACVGGERAYPPAIPVGRAWRMLRRLTFPMLDAIVAQTQRTADWYRDYLGVAPDRLAVIANVVSPPRTPTSEPIALPSDWAGKPVIAAIGRLDPQKGFDMALDVFAEVVRQRPDVRLLLVGDGPLAAPLRAQADALGIAGAVRFQPPIDDLARLWPQVDLFLLTSRFEGIPNVLIEAMANGVASVAFDCPTGPAEVIDDGTNGALVPLGDTALAAQRCVELLDDPSRRCQFDEAARSVVDRYSAARIGEAWNALVDCVARQR